MMAEVALQPPVFSASPAIKVCATSEHDVEKAFEKIKLRLAGTRFAAAHTSQICGLVRLELEGGKVAYTDLSGRYFILGLALDTQTGSPADASVADSQHSANPSSSLLQPK